jgi:hypothetical protein
MTTSVPVGISFFHSGFKSWPLKITIGGICVPKAIAHATIVTFLHAQVQQGGLSLHLSGPKPSANDAL